MASADENNALPTVCFPGKSDGFTIRLNGSKIASIEASSKTPTHMAFPLFHDLHVHANRAYSLKGPPPASFKDAVEIAVSGFAEASFEHFYERSKRLFVTAAGHGTGRIRTHADIDHELGCTALEASVAAAQDQSLLEVEQVAFLSARVDPYQDASRAMIASAMKGGATHLGAVPNFYERPDLVIERILELAKDYDVAIDLHLDEHLDPEGSFSELLARRTIHHAMEGRVTLSHGCAISVLPNSDRRNAIAAIADAAICVISLPPTNLYLQDRGDGSPQPRGLAPVKELLAHNVEVRVASDNVQDAFYPYGDADMIDVLGLCILGAHVDDEKALARMICGGQYEIHAGDPGDFVVFEGSSLRDVLGPGRTSRQVFRQGRLAGQ